MTHTLPAIGNALARLLPPLRRPQAGGEGASANARVLLPSASELQRAHP